MPTLTRRTAAATCRSVLATFVAATLATATGATLSGCTGLRPTSVDTASASPAPATPGGGSDGSGTAAAGGDIQPERWATARQQAVAGLVRNRILAVQQGDEHAWLEPLAPLGGSSGAPLRRTQAAVFERMSAIGVADLRLEAMRETTAPVPASAGTTVEWDVRVSLSYRIRDFDTAPRAFDLDLTLKADPAQPQRLTLTASAPSGRPQPWDLAGLEVRRSARALVLAVGDTARVDEISRRARTAASRVATVWGSARPAVWIAPGTVWGSARPAVWIAPATDADAAHLLGRSAGPDGLGGVAAATDGPLTAGEPAGADRIILVPGAWTSLRPDGRDVVMTHELTHVTVRASTTRAVPVWLSEGFAELVAYTPIDLPESAIVAPALALVRARGIPPSLPADADFSPGTQTLQAAYGLSLVAVRTLADARGTRAVVDLYRAAAGGLAVPTDRIDDREGIVDEALHTTMGTTRARLVRDWQARLRGLLR